ncbi:MAG: hypothetical protein H8D35_07095 [Nitrosopumilus sp.]|nr:hypothetical protein [Nitrosopumilus sp.]MBL7015071.1 hypothetical protein [Nitrosopumilus sp.]
MNNLHFSFTFTNTGKKVADYKSFFKIGGVTKKVQEKVNCSILLVDTPWT